MESISSEQREDPMIVLYGRYSRPESFFDTRRFTTEFGTAPGKKVLTDVSKSGEATSASAGEEFATSVDAANAESGALIRASLGVIRLSLSGTDANNAELLVFTSGATKALAPTKRLKAAANDPVFIFKFCRDERDFILKRVNEEAIGK